MLQPDFGTGVVIVVSAIVLLFVSGVNLSFFVKIGILGLIGIVVLIIIILILKNFLMTIL